MNSGMKGFPFDSFPKQHPQAIFPILRSYFSKERILKEKAWRYQIYLYKLQKNQGTKNEEFKEAETDWIERD